MSHERLHATRACIHYGQMCTQWPHSVLGNTGTDSLCNVHPLLLTTNPRDLPNLRETWRTLAVTQHCRPRRGAWRKNRGTQENGGLHKPEPRHGEKVQRGKLCYRKLDSVVVLCDKESFLGRHTYSPQRGSPQQTKVPPPNPIWWCVSFTGIIYRGRSKNYIAVSPRSSLAWVTVHTAASRQLNRWKSIL